MNDRPSRLTALLELSRQLGSPLRPLAILAEGNTSAKLGPDSFLVKASGSVLANLSENDLVECDAKGLLALLERDKISDAEVNQAIMQCRLDPAAKKPSVESLFHAWLLTLPGIEYVGHTHPCSATGILCSGRAGDFAARRLFPDEVVCCDVESVLVPYVDPGLPLAREIRRRTIVFQDKHQRPPRVILLENHGVITLGGTPEAVIAAMLMVEKSATIWTASASVGGPKFLSPKDVDRISGRADEALRRKALRI